MHALVITGLRSYFSQMHGADVWAKIATSGGYAAHDFELQTAKDDHLAETFLQTGCDILDRSRTDILEDFGSFLASHPTTSSIRRLMRFSGHDFMEFIVSLPDLAPRVRMAVPGLVLPRITVSDIEGGFELSIHNTMSGYDHVIAGVIRGMADDYGALVHVDTAGVKSDANTSDHAHWAVWVIDPGFSEGRSFNLVEVAS